MEKSLKAGSAESAILIHIEEHHNFGYAGRPIKACLDMFNTSVLHMNGYIHKTECQTAFGSRLIFTLDCLLSIQNIVAFPTTSLHRTSSSSTEDWQSEKPIRGLPPFTGNDNGVDPKLDDSQVCLKQETHLKPQHRPEPWAASIFEEERVLLRQLQQHHLSTQVLSLLLFLSCREESLDSSLHNLR